MTPILITRKYAKRILIEKDSPFEIKLIAAGNWIVTRKFYRFTEANSKWVPAISLIVQFKLCKLHRETGLFHNVPFKKFTNTYFS